MANQGQHTGARAVRPMSPDKREPMDEQVRGIHSTDEIGPSAYDIKDTHRLWNGLSDADLKQLPVVPEGTRLHQGGVYFDLNDPDRGEIKALGDMDAGPQHRYVAKSAVPYPLWNALIGVEDPDRLNVGDER